MDGEEAPYELYPTQSGFSDVNTRLRDIEEKQRLLKDRVLIMGKNLVEEREKSFEEIQELKSILLKLKEDTIVIKQAVQTMTEQINKTARKEEIEMIQRQLDILRKE